MAEALAALVAAGDASPTALEQREALRFSIAVAKARAAAPPAPPEVEGGRAAGAEGGGGTAASAERAAAGSPRAAARGNLTGGGRFAPPPPPQTAAETCPITADARTQQTIRPSPTVAGEVPRRRSRAAASWCEMPR